MDFRLMDLGSKNWLIHQRNGRTTFRCVKKIDIKQGDLKTEMIRTLRGKKSAWSQKYIILPPPS